METEGKLRADDWTIDRRWSCRRGHLESANEPRPGQIPWTDPPIHLPPKEFVFNRVARAAGDLPKNCHLSPFWCRKTAALIATVPFLLAPRGRAGQPGPRAENRARGQEVSRRNVAIECGLCRDSKVDSKGRVHQGV
jgi:hypothetical protein